MTPGKGTHSSDRCRPQPPWVTANEREWTRIPGRQRLQDISRRRGAGSADDVTFVRTLVQWRGIPCRGAEHEEHLAIFSVVDVGLVPLFRFEQRTSDRGDAEGEFNRRIAAHRVT